MAKMKKYELTRSEKVQNKSRISLVFCIKIGPGMDSARGVLGVGP